MHQFTAQVLPMPPRVKIHDSHYDYFYGEMSQIDYFPFCHETYYDWLLCHGMHLYQASLSQLQKATVAHKVSLTSLSWIIYLA